MNIMKKQIHFLSFALSIGVFLSILQCSESKRPSYMLNITQCTEQRQIELELEMARNSPLDSKSQKRFPVNYEEVRVYCRDINRIVAKTERFFKKCYDKPIKGYTQLIIYTLKRNMRKYCGKKTSKVVKYLLKLAPCANKHLLKNSEPRKCMTQFMNATSRLLHIKEHRLKIPHTCCNYVEGVKCAEEFLGSVPCLRAHVPTMLDYFRRQSSSITEMLCGEYNGQTDACEKLGPPPPPATKVPPKQYHTLLPLMIDLMESMLNDNYIPTPNGLNGFS